MHEGEVGLVVKNLEGVKIVQVWLWGSRELSLKVAV